MAPCPPACAYAFKPPPLGQAYEVWPPPKFLAGYATAKHPQKITKQSIRIITKSSLRENMTTHYFNIHVTNSKTGRCM